MINLQNPSAEWCGTTETMQLSEGEICLVLCRVRLEAVTESTEMLRCLLSVLLFTPCFQCAFSLPRDPLHPAANVLGACMVCGCVPALGFCLVSKAAGLVVHIGFWRTAVTPTNPYNIFASAVCLFSGISLQSEISNWVKSPPRMPSTE